MCATARRNARTSDAVMPQASMSAASTYSTVQATATCFTIAAMRSRASGRTCLESSKPSTAGSSGSTTAPTASGPAKGPRPHLVKTNHYPGTAASRQFALIGIQARHTLALGALACKTPASNFDGLAHASSRVGHERALQHGKLALSCFLQPALDIGHCGSHALSCPHSSRKHGPLSYLAHDTKTQLPRSRSSGMRNSLCSNRARCGMPMHPASRRQSALEHPFAWETTSCRDPGRQKASCASASSSAAKTLG